MDGEWEPPQVDNPEYKGKSLLSLESIIHITYAFKSFILTFYPFILGAWAPKQIENPAYKGQWVHPEIDNPDYSPNTELYRYNEVCGVGFDLWQVKSGTIFDNVLIGNDLEEAEVVRKKVLDGQVK